jgi:uncharacterized membrane protein
VIELNQSTGRTLRYGIITGLAVVLAGLIASIFSGDVSEKILWVGIGIIIFVPFVSIIVSALALYSEKDYYWLKRVLLLISILIVGLAVSILR